VKKTNPSWLAYLLPFFSFKHTKDSDIAMHYTISHNCLSTTTTQPYYYTTSCSQAFSTKRRGKKLYSSVCVRESMGWRNGPNENDHRILFCPFLFLRRRIFDTRLHSLEPNTTKATDSHWKNNYFTTTEQLKKKLAHECVLWDFYCSHWICSSNCLLYIIQLNASEGVIHSSTHRLILYARFN